MAFFPRAWVAPGGGVEVTEDLDFACLREVAEETGIQIDIGYNEEHSSLSN